MFFSKITNAISLSKETGSFVNPRLFLSSRTKDRRGQGVSMRHIFKSKYNLNLKKRRFVNFDKHLVYQEIVYRHQINIIFQTNWNTSPLININLLCTMCQQRDNFGYYFNPVESFLSFVINQVVYQVLKDGQRRLNQQSLKVQL